MRIDRIFRSIDAEHTMAIEGVARKALLALLLCSFAATAQDALPSKAVFGVPLGGTVGQVDRMASSRGYRHQASAAYCRDSEVCTRHSNIEQLPGTDFVNEVWGGRRFPDRTEGFFFSFVAPPNEARAWSIGSDQLFGDWSRPSTAAPLLSDVLAELLRRFGEPSVSLSTSGRVSARRDARTIWWAWDGQGQPLAWSRLANANCAKALSQTAVTPGYLYTGPRNTVVDPKPFLMARQANCAIVARAEIGHVHGVVYSLAIRIVDFKAGHDALVHTEALLREKRAQADQQRSVRNRPDF